MSKINPSSPSLMRRFLLILFWLAVLTSLLTVYFFYPSLFNPTQEPINQKIPEMTTPVYQG
jgi:hypothetical protein